MLMRILEHNKIQKVDKEQKSLGRLASIQLFIDLPEPYQNTDFRRLDSPKPVLEFLHPDFPF
jgi:hypothetical protein